MKNGGAWLNFPDPVSEWCWGGAVRGKGRGWGCVNNARELSPPVLVCQRPGTITPAGTDCRLWPWALSPASVLEMLCWFWGPPEPLAQRAVWTWARSFVLSHVCQRFMSQGASRSKCCSFSFHDTKRRPDFLSNYHVCMPACVCVGVSWFQTICHTH